mmetsp:Transcript_75712/g.157797  ORF Transcript_75712/g.157797 Transcript_75712/m.157797 type:complete len:398 (+) Transcript_75712:167-1360(+)
MAAKLVLSMPQHQPYQQDQQLNMQAPRGSPRRPMSQQIRKGIPYLPPASIKLDSPVKTARQFTSPGRRRPPVQIAMPSEDLRQVVLAANADGLDLLRRGRATAAFEHFKHAEAVLLANPSIAAADGGLLALTCSNLGCYYRKVGLPRAALQYLHRAMKAEEAVLATAPSPNHFELQQTHSSSKGKRHHGLSVSPGLDTSSLVKTKLNVCAVLSGVGNHERAEQLAAEAAHLLAPRCSAPVVFPSNATEEAIAAIQEQHRQDCSLLAVACHNLGAEREHLRRWSEAAVAYSQGGDVAARALGARSQLARSLLTSADNALAKVSRHPPLIDRPKSRGGGSGQQQQQQHQHPQQHLQLQTQPLPQQSYQHHGTVGTGALEGPHLPSCDGQALGNIPGRHE